MGIYIVVSGIMVRFKSLKSVVFITKLVSNANDFRGVFGEVLNTVKDTFGNLLQKFKEQGN
ncbi:hypothetical protein HpHA170_11980 [Helicobacter pylori]